MMKNISMAKISGMCVAQLKLQELAFIFGNIKHMTSTWKGQGSSPRPDIKPKYEKYFFGDFLSADSGKK